MTLLRKYGAWVLLVTLVVMAAAAFVAKHRAVQYSSNAQVDVEARLITGATPTAPNLATEKAVASSGAVLAGAAQAAGVPAGDLPAHVSVTAAGSSNILSIGCSMPEPATAQRCATAVANSYVAFRNDTSGSKTEQAQDPLHVTLVTPAALPNTPSGTKLPVLLSLGAFLGLALGVGSAFVRDRFDDRVRDRDDLERCLRASVIATIPRVRRAARATSVLSNDSSSPLAEAFRHLRVRLGPLIPPAGKRGTVLLVTGAQPGEGRTWIAGNLGVALALTGLRVLLVDADVRNASLSRSFEIVGPPGVKESLTGRPGLNQLLAGTAQLDDVTVPATVRGLTLVGAGAPMASSPDLFDSARLNRAFAEARQAADVVLVDSPGVLAASDPIALAGVSDVVLYVANVRRTRRAAVTSASTELRAVAPLAIVGVLNAVPRPLRASIERLGGRAGREPQGPEAEAGAANDSWPGAESGRGASNGSPPRTEAERGPRNGSYPGAEETRPLMLFLDQQPGTEIGQPTIPGRRGYEPNGN